MDDKELRDQLMTLLLAGHETTATALAWTFDLLLRHPRRARPPARLARRRRGRATCGRRSPSRLRLRPVVPLAGRRLADAAGRRRPRAAGRDRRHPGDLAHPHPRATSTPSPSPSAPSASSRASRTPTPGSPSAAASAAASAPPSPSSRCGSCSREILARSELRKASPAPERTGRRNITLSPQATGPRSSSPPRRPPPRRAATGRAASPPSRLCPASAGAPCAQRAIAPSRRSPRRCRGRGSAPRRCR